MIRTFVCYARSDGDFVLELADRLRSLGADVWLDRWSIPHGADWDRAIDEALHNCDVCVVVLSPASADSCEVRGEIRVALDERKPIVPVLHKTCDVPRQIRVVENIDVRDTTDLTATAAEVWAAVVRAKDQAIRNDLKPITKRPAAIDVRLQRTRYGNFLLMEPASSPVPVEVPPFSWVHTEQGLLSHGATPEDVGLNPADFSGAPPPHLPDGELFVDLTLAGRGPTAVISRVDLDIEGRWDLPARVAAGMFLGVLEPITDVAVISNTQRQYPLFGDRTIAIKAGEVDLLRVDVRIADEEGPGIFAFRFVITYNDGDEDRVARTPPLYLAKHSQGATSRMPVEKRPDAPTTSFDHQHRVAHPDVEDLWMDPRYPERLLEFSQCRNRRPPDDLQYLMTSYRRTVMGGQRSELQRNGFSRAPWADRVPKGNTFAPVFVPVDPTHGLGYRSASRGGVLIYQQRNTAEYDCLLEACHRLSSGPLADQQPAVTYLVTQLRSSMKRTRFAWINRLLGSIPKYGLDVAGVIDTLTLLSLFRSRDAYDVLVDFLEVEHPLVLHHVADILAYIRYRPAADALLQALKRPPSYATSAVLAALKLNGEPRFFDSIVEACAGFAAGSEELALTAAALVAANPRQAHSFAGANVDNEDESRRTLAFQILDLTKDASPDTPLASPEIP